MCFRQLNWLRSVPINRESVSDLRKALQFTSQINYGGIGELGTAKDYEKLCCNSGVAFLPRTIGLGTEVPVPNSQSVPISQVVLERLHHLLITHAT